MYKYTARIAYSQPFDSKKKNRKTECTKEMEELAPSTRIAWIPAEFQIWIQGLQCMEACLTRVSKLSPKKISYLQCWSRVSLSAKRNRAKTQSFN